MSVLHRSVVNKLAGLIPPYIRVQSDLVAAATEAKLANPGHNLAAKAARTPHNHWCGMVSKLAMHTAEGWLYHTQNQPQKHVRHVIDSQRTYNTTANPATQHEIS